MRIDGISQWSPLPQINSTAARPASDKGSDEQMFTTPIAAVTPPTQVAKSQDKEEDDQREKTPFEKIAEHGFSKFAEDLKAEKLEKMREEILKSMGLTEEDLGNMPADQRSVIEEMIATKIKEKMEAAQAVQQNEDSPNVLAVSGTANGVPLPNTGLRPATGQTGLGPFLAMQEMNDGSHAKLSDTLGKNDREERES